MKNSIINSTEPESVKEPLQQMNELKDKTMKEDAQQPKVKDNIVQLQVINKQKHKTQGGSEKKFPAIQSKLVDSNRYQEDSQATSDAFIIMRLNELDVMEETFGLSVVKELVDLVSERLQGCIRSVDILEQINRNEFAIMVTDVDSKDDIEKLVQRIEERCNGEYVCSGLKLYISVTAGISIAPQHSTHYEEQLRFARIALRHAEKRSTASFQFFSSDMLDDLQQRAAMIFELRQALKQQRFVLHYQPQYDVSTQKTVAVEALIRMQGQDGELIYPDGFIDLAEETGLILPIGHWVIQEACQQYRRWRDMGCAPKHIAVNVSAKQLADNSLIEIVDAAVKDAGIEYSNLELEITEQSLIKKIAMAESVLNDLSAKGIRLALDDFGTGYSSLSYLEQLPLNVLKIDRSFLQKMDKNQRSAGLIRAMIYVAKELDLEVVAEGVENEIQQQFIKSVGCHLGQGYGYSRPHNADIITSMLQAQEIQSEVSQCG